MVNVIIIVCCWIPTLFYIGRNWISAVTIATHCKLNPLDRTKGFVCLQYMSSSDTPSWIKCRNHQQRIIKYNTLQILFYTNSFAKNLLKCGFFSVKFFLKISRTPSLLSHTIPATLVIFYQGYSWFRYWHWARAFILNDINISYR